MNKRILKIESVVEAMKIRDILDSHEIPHIIRSFHDSAYDGLFQQQLGWGILEADEADEEKILDLLKEEI